MLFGGISAAVDLFGEPERGWDLMDPDVSVTFPLIGTRILLLFNSWGAEVTWPDSSKGLPPSGIIWSMPWGLVLAFMFWRYSLVVGCDVGLSSVEAWA